MPKQPQITFELSYGGASADNNEVDFYDISRALVGFQRSLALTTHLVLHDEVITQSTALRGVYIVASPPEFGSWKFSASIVGLASFVYVAGTAPQDTPLGHIVFSAYDYVISESLGFHVDYDKSIGQLYEMNARKEQDIPILDQNRFDSVIEKVENAVRDIHRPIVNSKSANYAVIKKIDRKIATPLHGTFSEETFDYINVTTRSTIERKFRAKISSYNVNTFIGRCYIAEYNRPVPFELSQQARSPDNIEMITKNLYENARSLKQASDELTLTALTNESKHGRLKSIFILSVE
ncbi:MAG: hypothetical protein GC199_00635 [Alphaproteobacteria bacterium]|nr:hypothetical protein [Alphaproteobacteria bacterium]